MLASAVLLCMVGSLLCCFTASEPKGLIVQPARCSLVQKTVKLAFTPVLIAYFLLWKSSQEMGRKNDGQGKEEY